MIEIICCKRPSAAHDGAMQSMTSQISLAILVQQDVGINWLTSTNPIAGRIQPSCRIIGLQ